MRNLLKAPLHKVLHGIPIPPRSGGPGRGREMLPFADMEAGDCFVATDANIATIATNWAWERKLPRKWSKRSLGEGRYGLWRVQ